MSMPPCTCNREDGFINAMEPGCPYHDPDVDPEEEERLAEEQWMARAEEGLLV